MHQQHSFKIHKAKTERAERRVHMEYEWLLFGFLLLIENNEVIINCKVFYGHGRFNKTSAFSSAELDHQLRFVLDTKWHMPKPMYCPALPIVIPDIVNLYLSLICRVFLKHLLCVGGDAVVPKDME